MQQTQARTRVDLLRLIAAAGNDSRQRIQEIKNHPDFRNYPSTYQSGIIMAERHATFGEMHLLRVAGRHFPLNGGSLSPQVRYLHRNWQILDNAGLNRMEILTIFGNAQLAIYNRGPESSVDTQTRIMELIDQHSSAQHYSPAAKVVVASVMSGVRTALPGNLADALAHRRLVFVQHDDGTINAADVKMIYSENFKTLSGAGFRDEDIATIFQNADVARFTRGAMSDEEAIDAVSLLLDENSEEQKFMIRSEPSAMPKAQVYTERARDFIAQVMAGAARASNAGVLSALSRHRIVLTEDADTIKFDSTGRRMLPYPGAQRLDLMEFISAKQQTPLAASRAERAQAREADRCAGGGESASSNCTKRKAQLQ